MSFDAHATVPLIVPLTQASPTAIEVTERAALAARFVNSTDRHVFLTGKAGTGKTTFLHQLARSTHKRYVILAPTGIAALNAGGVTIHSQFQLPIASFVPERHLPDDVGEYGAFVDQHTLGSRHFMSATRRTVLREADLLIIDEVSMLRADLLDAVDQRMRSVRRSSRGFGGAQLLLIGDLFQLPPVVKDAEWRVLRRWYRSPHFFSSRALERDGYAHVELDRIFRQQDEHFIHILNNLRNNTVTPADVEELNRHHRRSTTGDADVITLTTHNARADEINQRALAKLPGRSHAFEATIQDDFPDSMHPVPRRIELKEGARAMFTRNDTNGAYFNGRLATVTRIDDGGVTVVMDGTSEPYALKQETWENKRYTVNAVTREQTEAVIGTFAQFPVRLAWAITVHKSQGLTFDRAIIDVGSAFAPGQVYVALSRLRSLDGLVLHTPIDPSVVSTDRDVVAFHARGEEQEPLPDQLKARQAEYLRDLLAGTFDLTGVAERAGYVCKDNESSTEFEDKGMRDALSVLIEKLGAEEENTRRFRTQLTRLLAVGDHAGLLERLEKGGAYYADFILGCMRQLLGHLAQVERLRRTKQYAEALRELDGQLMKKMTEISKAAYLTHCILTGVDIERQSGREKAIVAHRSRIIEEVGGLARGQAPRTTTRSGRVRKRKDGTERKEKKVKGETYLKTYALLKQGLSAEAIAAERSLSVSTIEGHFARGILSGEVAIGTVMPDDRRDELSGWMRTNADKSFNEALAHFAGRSTYGQLRMVRAWLDRSAAGDEGKTVPVS